jgi:hypothetical protein
VGNCGTSVASRDSCLKWVQDGVKAMGCSVQPATVDTACKIHPWGSDFIKSWICTAKSPDCDSFVHDQKECPEGMEHLFKNGWDACKKTVASQKFLGVCRHTMESHVTTLTSCPETLSVCGRFGGVREKLSVLCDKKSQGQSLKEPIEIAGETYACEDIAQKCTSGGGTIINEWKVQCSFRDTMIQRVEKSCKALRDRCELGNSPQGAKGTLESCELAK